MSLCLHKITREPLNEFSRNLILGSFTKLCRQIKILFKTRQQLQALDCKDLHAFPRAQVIGNPSRAGAQTTTWGVPNTDVTDAIHKGQRSTGESASLVIMRTFPSLFKDVPRILGIQRSTCLWL
jgi:hypothetical protein